MSRWRTEPDWISLAGRAGRWLLVAGLVVAGFVAYQLWGTGLETARAQRSLEERFDQVVAAVPVTQELTNSDGPVGEGSGADQGSGDAGRPRTDGVGEHPGVGGRSSGELVEEPVRVEVEEGDPVARIDIPAVGVEGLFVVEGVSLDALKLGPGRYPSSVLPGQDGVAAIAGHRTTYGAPFFDLGELVAGDEIVVSVVTGDRVVFEVVEVEVVEVADASALERRVGEGPVLVLTTCHPKYTSSQRLVVRSVLVPEESDDPAPVVVASTAAKTMVPSTSTTITTLVSSGGEDGDAVVDASASKGDVSIAVRNDLVDEPQLDDAFAGGWFTDRAAWPHVSVWAGLVVLVVLAAGWVNQRARWRWTGTGLAVAPVLVGMYFVYQNVSRLLPPGF